MPNKFDQMIGESGVEQLSGGQKQVLMNVVPTVFFLQYYTVITTDAFYFFFSATQTWSFFLFFLFFFLNFYFIYFSHLVTILFIISLSAYSYRPCHCQRASLFAPRWIDIGAGQWIWTRGASGPGQISTWNFITNGSLVFFKLVHWTYHEWLARFF